MKSLEHIDALNPYLLAKEKLTISEWLESKERITLLAAACIASVWLYEKEEENYNPETNKLECEEQIDYALENEMVYVADISGRSIAVFVNEECSALVIKYSPDNNILTYQYWSFGFEGNSVEVQMSLEESEDEWVHVSSDALKKERAKILEELSEDEMNSFSEVFEETLEGYDDSEDEDELDVLYDCLNECNKEEEYKKPRPRSTYDDPETWYEDGHLNPYGTTDVGDGYIDDDGVYTEY